MKTILMLPSWYPTKDNPFAGSFFREQAIAMSSNFNFVVCNITHKRVLAIQYLLMRLIGIATPKIKFYQDDCGLKEYSVKAYKPQYIFIDLLIDRIATIRGKKRLGVGEKESLLNKSARLYNAKKIFKSGKLPKIDCVYSLTSQDYAALGDAFAKCFKVPHVTAEHAPFPWPGRVLRDTTVSAIENADRFLAISQDKIRQVLLQNIKIDPYYVGNLVDEDVYFIDKKVDRVKTFLIVAANSFYKNLELFIRAMEELKLISSVEFKIKLAGFNSNKGYSQSSEQLINRINSSTIKDIIELVPSVERKDMVYLYNSCDAFVMTSIQEGLPVSAIEASMCGLPVFSTRCGGVEDYIDDDMGKIVSILDYKKLAQHCNDFLTGSVKYDSQLIRKKTIACFGKKVFVDRISAVFNEVMGEM